MPRLLTLQERLSLQSAEKRLFDDPVTDPGPVEAVLDEVVAAQQNMDAVAAEVMALQVRLDAARQQLQAAQEKANGWLDMALRFRRKGD